MNIAMNSTGESRVWKLRDGRRMVSAVCASIVFLVTPHLLAAFTPSGAAPVAAKVGGEPVYVAEVDDLVARTRAARRGEHEVAPELRAEALAQAIHRRLVARYLAKEGYTPTDIEVDGLVDDLKRRLDAQGLSLEDFLKRHSFTSDILRRQLAWDLMWGRYLASEMTDEALKKYFEAHRRDYDGTELRVSQVLLRVENPNDRDQLSEAERRASQLREQVVSGKLTFAEAAARYSSGPSRRQAGDLGFIPRHDRMTEIFSRAAFKLDIDEISPPVIDQFGVHLIRCTEIKPGKKSWQDVRRALAEAWASEQFLELAGQQRKQTHVEYTGVVPHFDPSTNALVPAAGDR